MKEQTDMGGLLIGALLWTWPCAWEFLTSFLKLQLPHNGAKIPTLVPQVVRDLLAFKNR